MELTHFDSSDKVVFVTSQSAPSTFTATGQPSVAIGFESCYHEGALGIGRCLRCCLFVLGGILVQQWWSRAFAPSISTRRKVKDAHDVSLDQELVLWTQLHGIFVDDPIQCQLLRRSGGIDIGGVRDNPQKDVDQGRSSLLRQVARA